MVDLERGFAAAAKHDSGCSANASPKACVIAVQHLDGRAIPINAIITEVDGGFILSSSQKQIFQAVTGSWFHRLVGNLIMGLVVGTARVKQVSQPSGSQLDVSLISLMSLLQGHVLRASTMLRRTSRTAISNLPWRLHSRPPTHRSTLQPAPPLKLSRLPSRHRQRRLFTWT